MPQSPFTRRLVRNERGPDVEGIGRALCHAGLLMNIRLFHRMPKRWKRTYGARKRAAVNEIRRTLGMSTSGVYDERVHLWLRSRGKQMDGHFDAYGINLMLSFQPKIVHPLAAGPEVTICQSFHETGGLLGNIAIDFCSRIGTPVVAVVDAKIEALTGSPPAQDVDDPGGVYGWSIHYSSSGGYRWFLTHLGKRSPGLSEGDRVLAGELLGWLGDQEFRLDHIHEGVTSPLGKKDAQKMIDLVSKAPRVPPQAPL
jgi:murein DD-endopeptidase MepM/ murein hydrolase activator NlpD